MIEMIWIVKKIRHMIESCRKSFVIIFIDHAATADLIKQIFLTTFNIDKLNLRFVRAFQFLSTLSIKIRIKSEKFYVMFDALFRLKINFDSKKNVFLNKKKSNETAVFENLNDVKKFFVYVKRLKHWSFWNVWFHHVNEILKAHFDEKTILSEMSDKFKKTLKKHISTIHNEAKFDRKFFFEKIKTTFRTTWTSFSKKIDYITFHWKKCLDFAFHEKWKKTFFKLFMTKIIIANFIARTLKSLKFFISGILQSDWNATFDIVNSV